MVWRHVVLHVVYVSTDYEYHEVTTGAMRVTIIKGHE
jgi:hypothetical protein